MEDSFALWGRRKEGGSRMEKHDSGGGSGGGKGSSTRSVGRAADRIRIIGIGG